MRNNKGFEADVDMSTVDEDAHYYVVEATPSTIYVDGDVLTVRDSNGTASARENFNGRVWTKEVN